MLLASWFIFLLPLVIDSSRPPQEESVIAVNLSKSRINTGGVSE